MNKGGRRQDPIWESFYKLSVDGKTVAKCKKCGNIQSNKAARMKAHVSSCEKNLTNECVNVEESSSSERPAGADLNQNKNCLDTMIDAEVDKLQPLSKKVRYLEQCNIKKFVSKTSNEDKRKIDLIVAKFFYACNISFNVVESDAFHDLIRILRPSYTLPSRKELAGSLLDSVHSQVEELVHESLKGKEGTLVIDGWSNIHNEPITAACVQVDGKSYIVDVEHTGATKKTAEFLSKKCSDIIQNVEKKYNCEIKSIVTDNAKNMEKMRQDLELKYESENSCLISYGCSAHWLNLLGQDITPDTIIKHVVEVHKYFRNHHAPSAWLKECKECVSPQLPGSTRWNSQLTCLETFERNHNSYIKVSNDHLQEMDQCIVARIRDFNLLQQVKDLIMQLTPVSRALDTLQSNSTTVADACHLWCKLLKDDNLKPHFVTVKKRFSQSILPWHLLAYLLHPKYRGEYLSYEQKEKARECLQKINPSFLSYAVNFELKEKPFQNTLFSEQVIMTIDASKWWRSVAKSCEISKEFCGLIAHLQACPSSSASIERIFSNFSFIHTKLRNRLTITNVSKLVFCYGMLKKELFSNDDECAAEC